MEQVILVVPKCSQILCYTQISADYLLLHSPKHIKLKFDTEFNIFPHNQQFTISFPFPIFILLFFFLYLPRCLKLKCYRNPKCFFLFYISHQSWVWAVFNFKSISNPLCPLHLSGYCCSAILMRFWSDHCNNFLRGFHMSSLAHSIPFSVLLLDDYML